MQAKGRFDRLATWADDQTSRAWFFGACMGLVICWLLSGPAFKFGDTWHLLLNSPTTSVTFLLVALGANTARRSNAALHAKLDAQAKGLRDLMEHVAETDCNGHSCSLLRDIDELEESVGLEEEVGTKKEESG